MVWYFHLFQNFPQFVVIHTVKGFSIVNKTEGDVFLKLSCFFDDPTNVGSLISGSPQTMNLIRRCYNISLKYNSYIIYIEVKKNKKPKKLLLLFFCLGHLPILVLHILFCGSEFLSDSISIHPEEPSLWYHIKQIYWQRIMAVFFYMKMASFCLVFE